MIRDILLKFFQHLYSSSFTLFQYLYSSSYTLGYLAFTVLSYSLYLDWVQIQEEFLGTIYIETATCSHLYESNQCNTPIPAMVKQCAEWYTCTGKHNVPGTLIWAEVIKRFLNSLLALDPHAMILITIVLLLLIDRGIIGRILEISKDIIRFFLVCATVICGIWLISLSSQ